MGVSEQGQQLECVNGEACAAGQSNGSDVDGTATPDAKDAPAKCFNSDDEATVVQYSMGIRQHSSPTSYSCQGPVPTVPLMCCTLPNGGSKQQLLQHSQQQLASPQHLLAPGKQCGLFSNHSSSNQLDQQPAGAQRQQPSAPNSTQYPGKGPEPPRIQHPQPMADTGPALRNQAPGCRTSRPSPSDQTAHCRGGSAAGVLSPTAMGPPDAPFSSGGSRPRPQQQQYPGSGKHQGLGPSQQSLETSYRDQNPRFSGSWGSAYSDNGPGHKGGLDRGAAGDLQPQQQRYSGKLPFSKGLDAMQSVAALGHRSGRNSCSGSSISSSDHGSIRSGTVVAAAAGRHQALLLPEDNDLLADVVIGKAAQVRSTSQQQEQQPQHLLHPMQVLQAAGAHISSSKGGFAGASNSSVRGSAPCSRTANGKPLPSAAAGKAEATPSQQQQQQRSQQPCRTTPTAAAAAAASVPMGNQPLGPCSNSNTSAAAAVVMQQQQAAHGWGVTPPAPPPPPPPRRQQHQQQQQQQPIVLVPSQDIRKAPGTLVSLPAAATAARTPAGASNGARSASSGARSAAAAPAAVPGGNGCSSVGSTTPAAANGKAPRTAAAAGAKAPSPAAGGKGVPPPAPPPGGPPPQVSLHSKGPASLHSNGPVSLHASGPVSLRGNGPVSLHSSNSSVPPPAPPAGDPPAAAATTAVICSNEAGREAGRQLLQQLQQHHSHQQQQQPAGLTQQRQQQQGQQQGGGPSGRQRQNSTPQVGSHSNAQQCGAGMHLGPIPPTMRQQQQCQQHHSPQQQQQQINRMGPLSMTASGPNSSGSSSSVGYHRGDRNSAGAVAANSDWSLDRAQQQNLKAAAAAAAVGGSSTVPSSRQGPPAAAATVARFAGGGSSNSNSSARATFSSSSSRPGPGSSVSAPPAAAVQRVRSKDNWGSVPSVVSPLSATAKSPSPPVVAVAAKQQYAQAAALAPTGEILDELPSGFQGTATAAAAAATAHGMTSGVGAGTANQRQNTGNPVATMPAAAAGSAASQGKGNSISSSSSGLVAPKNQEEPAPAVPVCIRSAAAAPDVGKASVQPADLDSVRPTAAAAADPPAASKPRTDLVVIASCLPEDEDDLLGITSSGSNSKIKQTLDESTAQQQQQRAAVGLAAAADVDSSQQHGQKGSTYTSQQQQQKQQGLLGAQPPPPPRKADSSHDGSGSSSSATVSKVFGVSGSSGMRSGALLQYSSSMSPPLPQPAHRMVLSPTGMTPVWTAYSTGMIGPAAAAAAGIGHPLGMPVPPGGPLPPPGTIANHARQAIGSPAPVIPGVMLSPKLQHSPQMQHMQQQQHFGGTACPMLVKPAPSKRLEIVDPRSRKGSHGQLNGQTMTQLETAGSADINKDQIVQDQISRVQISKSTGNSVVRSACGEAAVASALLQV